MSLTRWSRRAGWPFDDAGRELVALEVRRQPSVALVTSVTLRTKQQQINSAPPQIAPQNCSYLRSRQAGRARIPDGTLFTRRSGVSLGSGVARRSGPAFQSSDSGRPRWSGRSRWSWFARFTLQVRRRRRQLVQELGSKCVMACSV